MLIGHLLLDEAVEPVYSLEEGLLLRPSNALVLQISTNGEAVLNIGEEVDLPRDVHFEQNIFRLSSLLRREDCIGFWGPSSAITSVIPASIDRYHIPAAAILNGPCIALTSSASIKLGWAT